MGRFVSGGLFGVSVATMTSLPASQAWLYVRNNSSFLVKRNGVQFSREPGNLTQLNTYKSSGLCNDKAIDINLDEDGKLVMALKAPKRASKPSKSLTRRPFARTSGGRPRPSRARRRASSTA